MNKYSIVFDNNCAVCSFGVRSFNKAGLLNNDSIIELSEHEKNDIACNVNPQQACDEMAVINNQTKEVRYGVDGYLLLLENKSPKLSKLINHKLGKAILNPIYKFIASNRRILAPKAIKSDTCNPTLKVKYRLSLMLLLGVFSAVITFLKGELLADSEYFNFLNGYKLLQVTGVGWILTGLLYQKENKWEYWGHLSVIAGSAIFIQFLALIGYQFLPHIGWVIGSMLLSDLLMIVMHYRRMKMLNMSQEYTFRWWLILHLTAGLSMAQYYLFN